MTVRMGLAQHAVCASSGKRGKVAGDSAREVAPASSDLATSIDTEPVSMGRGKAAERAAEWDEGMGGESSRSKGWPLIEAYRKQRRSRSQLRGGTLMTSRRALPSIPAASPFSPVTSLLRPKPG